jgi:excisionase family DNA binding protein
MQNSSESLIAADMTISEACRYLGIGRTKLRELIKKGLLRSQKKAGRRTIDAEALHHYRIRHVVPGASLNARTRISGNKLCVGTGPNRFVSNLKAGLWKFDGESSFFVVFSMGQTQQAFLLCDWNGHPGYTSLNIAQLHDAAFVSQVEIGVVNVGSFAPIGAVLGQLEIRDGIGLVTSIDDFGKLRKLEIAPLESDIGPGGDFYYSWGLFEAGNISHSDTESLYVASGNQSWLNTWITPEFEVDEEDPQCPFCEKETMEFKMSSQLIVFG